MKKSTSRIIIVQSLVAKKRKGIIAAKLMTKVTFFINCKEIKSIKLSHLGLVNHNTVSQEQV